VSRRVALRVAVLVIAATGPAGAARAAAVSDPGCGVMTVVQRLGGVTYPLPRGFLQAGSDSVWSSRRALVRGVDFTIDRARGVLRMLHEPVPGETLWVAACWLLAPPPAEHRLHVYRPVRGLGDSAAADSLRESVPPQPRPITTRPAFAAPAGTSLELSGNKTIAVDFGSSQDAFLRQSLDLGVSGTLAPGVELTGVLSDRNTPLNTTGSTQDLQSIDRLLIELRAPGGGAALGDVDLSLQQGEFARLERRLQGVRGEWTTGPARAIAAAASAQGEFHRMQFFGVEGQQGPYQLTDRNGGAGITVVAGSEVVVLDGQRLARGEGADYAIDYERARLTFSNRRPITSSSRITVDYQFSVNRFRRNLAAAQAGWQRGGLSLSTTFLNETDDRGSPIDLAFDDSDRLVLASVGDSAALAVGSGVTTGGGDYDLIRDTTATAHYAFAGVDSGDYRVSFARVGTGAGDYADSAVVGGRVAYRWVGAGNGTFRIGRALPLPDAHQLWSVGGTVGAGPLSLRVEGALSRRDRNTFSGLDDGDNLGRAGSARLGLEGTGPSWLRGGAGLHAEARSVAPRFAPFTRLERPFEQEDWGLPIDADLEHQDRVEVGGFVRSAAAGTMRGSLGRLETPDGFRSTRQEAGWSRDGRLAASASWERADGHRDGMAFGDGGRERTLGDVALRLRWLEPALRLDWDQRRTPSDTGLVGVRSREVTAELRTPATMAWRPVAAWILRREWGLETSGWSDRSEARTARLGIESPATARLGGLVTWSVRDFRPVGAGMATLTRTRSDLATARLRAAEPSLGLSGDLGVEITSEGENPRLRALTFVGPGQGAYDSLGNFVGTGDYELALIVSPSLRRLARSATSARAAWQFGASETWRGSRLQISFESDARRRGDLHASDAMLSPGAALGDTGLSRGAVTQRLEADVAPGSRAVAVRARLERRVTADRSLENFAQTVDETNATLRWRPRPAPAWTAEVEARWKRQEALQALSSGGGFGRTLVESGALAQLVYTPDARLRAAMSIDAGWLRPEQAAAAEYTRTVRIGPDFGVSIGHGRLETLVRRAFVSGPPALGLLPSADPAGAARWEGTTRFDQRVRESITLGLTFGFRERTDRAPEYDGRAELRAFF